MKINGVVNKRIKEEIEKRKFQEDAILLERNRNAIIIQCCIRMFLARRKVKQMKYNKIRYDAAVVIQCKYRQIKSKFIYKILKIEHKKKVRSEAAIKIQNYYRMYTAVMNYDELREKFLDEETNLYNFYKNYKAAITIQCLYRVTKAKVYKNYFIDIITLFKRKSRNIRKYGFSWLSSIYV